MSEEKYTFEKVWQMFQETSKQIQELRDSQKETDRLIKANAKQIGGIDSSNGMMAEETIYNALKKNMTFGKIEFDDITRNMKLHSKLLNLEGEFDVVLKNGDTLAIIETKYKVRLEDLSKIIEHHVPNFKKLFPVFNNYKIVLGIGGMSFEKDVEKTAKENGIGIIKIVGDNVEYYTENIKIY